MNPLFKALGGGAMPSMPGPLGNFQQMVRKFQEFKAFQSTHPLRGATLPPCSRRMAMW